MKLRVTFALFSTALLGALSPAQDQAKETLAEELVFFEEPNKSKALEMLESGDMHVYAYGLSDPEIKKKVESSKNTTLSYSYGNVWELTINPAGGPEFKNGKLNPFAVPAIREALNWLIDRNYVAQELCFGLARPKYLPIVSAFPDYARLADVCRALEIKYGHNPEKAKEIITREMEKLGATQKDGKWVFKNEPVQIQFLIRTEDVRKRMGDYISTLLEGVGFSVDRQYKTASEASPIWIASDPADGKWHLYTGGWINTFIDRDQGNVFNSYYTSKSRPDPLWQAYKPTPEFEEIADRLQRNDYKTWDERMKLMAEALEMCNQECFRIWLVDTVNYFPLRKDIQVASDLAGGINGSYLWAQTIRSTNKGTTRVKIGMPSIMTEPWNPVAGSNWIYDTMIIRGTRIDPAIPDPYTGLFLPFNVKSVEITAQQGTPMVKSLDWVDLKFVPEIEVPADAYISWDAKEQRFITVKEKEPKGLKARTKSIVRYNDDVLKKHWHDGTVQSLPDFLLSVILTFEISLKDSPIFDEGTVPAYQSFVQFFRGFRIVQEDPLVVEYYSDQPYPDAETLAYWAAIFNYNANPWQMLAIGITAESEKKLAFSADKADKLKIERMSYIAGPSLPILEDVLKKAEANGSIPYEKTLGKWISKEQAKERYAALRKFYEKKKHFWIGNGPYLIDSIHSIEKTVVCKRFEEFKEADPRWLNFSEPRIADVAVTGPAKVTIGSPAEFQVKVTFKGKPYPAKDIDFVKFLIFNSKGDLVMSANADAGTDGEWIAKLPPEKTKELKPGSNRLEVAVSPKVVSMPSFGSLRFVSLGGGR